MSSSAAARRVADIGSVNLSREFVFAGTFAVAAINALIVRVYQSIDMLGGFWSALASTFDVNAVIWLALAGGLFLLRDSAASTPVRSHDFAVCGVAVAAVLVPVWWLSWVAMSVVGAYGVMTSERGSRLRRAGAIFIAASVPLFWGAAIVRLVGPFLLDIDAMFLATIAAGTREGNLVTFQNGSPLLVGWPCSSFHGISLVILGWTLVSRFFNYAFEIRDLIFIAAGCAGVVGINALRLAAMAWFPEHFQYIHDGPGAAMASLATIALIFAVCIVGVRGKDEAAF